MSRAVFSLVALVILLASTAPVGARETDRIQAPPPAGPPTWEGLLDRLRFSGILDGEARWRRHLGHATQTPTTSSDLYLRQFNLGLEADLLQGASATVVLNSEWIGDYENRGSDGISLDEVHFDLGGDESGPYFRIGKRTQPFGLFENDQLTDPITQDAYETNRTGACIGIHGGSGADLSLTIYKGKGQMRHLFQSGLFDTAAVQLGDGESRHVDSFIVSGLVTPWSDRMTTFVSFLDESGSRSRNSTVDAGCVLSPPFARNITVDIEAARALQRERYIGAERAYHEGTLSMDLSYQFLIRKWTHHGSANYSARRSALRSHPMNVLLRYERFDDDGLAESLHGWSLRERWCVGGRYPLRDDRQVLAYVQAEYRRSTFRDGADHPASDNEIFIRLGMSF